MNNTLRTILIVSAVLVVGAALFLGGMFFNRMYAWNGSYAPGSMMNGYAPDGQQGYYAPGNMMGGGTYGNMPNDGYGGMMGNNSYGNMSDGGYGSMMGNGSYGNMMNGGMMGGYGALNGVEPLTVDEAHQAVEDYLASFGNDDLAIEEIMTFDNNAYAIVVEKSTGVGAFELLVDPVTQAVFPEYGPNMMWNLKYGMMSDFGGYGMMGPGMMMGNSAGANGMGYGSSFSDSNDMMDYAETDGMMDGTASSDNAQAPAVSADMPVSAEEASQVAQNYLDAYYPGVQVSDEITAFYGYYTMDIERDGAIIGMMSVNGFTSQVFPHTWHGTFLEMSEE